MAAVVVRRAGYSGIRLLSALALVLGLLTIWADGARSATFSTIISPNNNFQAGTVDIGGLLTGSTASTMPLTAFSWTSSGAGALAQCGSLLTGGTTITAQSMTPGQYCVAPVTIRNDNLVSIDAWMRVRLVRRTAAGSTEVEALNDRLRFFMHEYTSGTVQSASAYQAADCTATGYKPVATVAGTAPSSATIPDVTNATAGSRTAISSVTTAGVNIGKHPVSTAGLGLRGGTAAAPTDANMSTNPAVAASYNAYNLIGNDEVHNPRLISNSNAVNGTRPGGTLPEAQLLARTSRYYCLAIYLPSDSEPPTGSSLGDNAAQNASVSYHLVVNATQKANRTVN